MALVRFDPKLEDPYGTGMIESTDTKWNQRKPGVTDYQFATLYGTICDPTHVRGDCCAPRNSDTNRYTHTHINER